MTQPAKITVSGGAGDTAPGTATGDNVGSPPIASIEDVRREVRDELLDAADRMRQNREAAVTAGPTAAEVEALARAYVILGDAKPSIDPATHDAYVTRVKALEDRARQVIYTANELGTAYFEAPVFERFVVTLRDLARELDGA